MPSTYPTVKVNYNVSASNDIQINFKSSFIVGVSQRGPIYSVVNITDINDFLLAFGQPTNKYEYDFFKSVKATLQAGAIARCYRIPYSNNDRDLYGPKFNYIVINKAYLVFNNESTLLRDQKNGDLYKFDIIKDIAEYEARLELKRVIDPDPDRRILDQFTVLTEDEKYYDIYVYDGKLQVAKTTDESHIMVAIDSVMLSLDNKTWYELYVDDLDYQFDDEDDKRYYIARLYMVNYDLDLDSMNVADIIYDINNKYLNKSAKSLTEERCATITFTLKNDFESAIKILPEENQNEIDMISACRDIKTDIDPSQIIGVFPFLYGTRDAFNLRNVNYGEIYYYDERRRFDENYIGQYNLHPYDNAVQKRRVRYSKIKDLFIEFGRSKHFSYDWFEKMVNDLVDSNSPRDLSSSRNTLGVAFVALYLNDAHELDYIVLESFYGMIGTSNNRYDDLEKQINDYSRWFRVEIKGNIDRYTYTRALSNASKINGQFIVPMASPNPCDDKIIDTDNIFATVPKSKFNPEYGYSLKTLYDRLARTEFLNSSPFDYIDCAGMTDILSLKTEVTKANNDFVPYDSTKIDLVNDTEYVDVNDHNQNVLSFNKFLAQFTQLGDKGIIAFIDIPEYFNTYFKSRSESWINEAYVKDDVVKLQNVIPSLSGMQGLYDRVYPLFNYQYVDKDPELTRYHKNATRYDFELIPGSIVALTAYLYNDSLDNYAPIAGQICYGNFVECHGAYVQSSNELLYSMLFDQFEVSSIINNRNNGTYPVQQVTWKQSTSVLKQLHAFRVYIAIRRLMYSIMQQYLYEGHTTQNLSNMQRDMTNGLNLFKKNRYIDSGSNIVVWATQNDVDNNQVNCQVTIGIFGAIVRINLNMNLTSATIDYDM